MKPRLNYSLLNLLGLVALVAGGFGLHRALWVPNLSNDRFFVAIYVGILAIPTVWAFSSRPPLGKALLVFVIVGWAYFVVVRLDVESSAVGGARRTAQLGLGVASLSALAGYLCFSTLKPRE